MPESHSALFEAALANPPPYPVGRFEGRGIVICAGGAKLFPCAWVLIGMLRRVLGCRLPIQLWHLGPGEMDRAMCELIEPFEIEIVDAFAVARERPVRLLGGWELKPYALIHSRFREAMLIDADNLPVADPAAVFDWPQYREAGSLLWPDIIRLRADNPIWQICAVPYRPVPSFESGQLLVDKQRCWQALQLAQHMNEHSDFYYRHLHGDKDTFFMSWLRLDQPFAMTPHPPLFMYAALYQRDFRGDVLFQHRFHAKWTLERENPRVPAFRHEAACLGLLEELREKWDGRLVEPVAEAIAGPPLSKHALQGRPIDLANYERVH